MNFHHSFFQLDLFRLLQVQRFLTVCNYTGWTKKSGTGRISINDSATPSNYYMKLYQFVASTHLYKTTNLCLVCSGKFDKSAVFRLPLSTLRLFVIKKLVHSLLHTTSVPQLAKRQLKVSHSHKTLSDHLQKQKLKKIACWNDRLPFI